MNIFIHRLWGVVHSTCLEVVEHIGQAAVAAAGSIAAGDMVLALAALHIPVEEAVAHTGHKLDSIPAGAAAGIAGAEVDIGSPAPGAGVEWDTAGPGPAVFAGLAVEGLLEGVGGAQGAAELAGLEEHETAGTLGK